MSKEVAAPKADSKLAPSEREFRKNRQKQLDNWEKDHPATRRSAAQHLGTPTKRAPAKASNSASLRNKSKDKKAA